jgi:hypothetical protein
MHSSLRTLARILPALLLLAACKAKPGDKCDANWSPRCADATSAQVCANNVVTALPCRGPKACTVSASTVTCDNSLAAVNDACDQPNDVACAVDHKTALECQNGKFVVAETCKGARGCVVDGDNISCDNDVADLGDPCHTEGDYACTADKLMALKCTAHKFDALNTCRGKDGCRVMELPEEKKTDFVCDDSLAQENDACDTQGEEACSMDKTELLSCKSNHFSKDHACPGGCTFDDKGERFECVLQAATATAAATSPTKPTTKAVASITAKAAPPKLAAKAVAPVKAAAKKPAAKAAH